MKPSLAYSQRLSSRVVRQTQRQHCALRTLSSARPLPEERHVYVNHGSILPERVNGSTSSNGSSSRLNQKTVSAPETVTRTSISPSVVMPHDNSNDEQIREHDSPSEIHYTGSTTMPLTTVLHIVKPQEDVPRGIWPVFRLMVSVH